VLKSVSDRKKAETAPTNLSTDAFEAAEQQATG
jgi:hypothetical protein